MKKQLFVALAALAIVASCNKKTEETTTTTTTVEATPPVIIDSVPPTTTDAAANVPGFTSIDPAAWAGTYSGVVPMADAAGNNMSLKLNTDKTYSIENDVNGIKSTDTGNWSIDANGRIITLNLAADPVPARFVMQDNALVRVDDAGNPQTPETRLVKN